MRLHDLLTYKVPVEKIRLGSKGDGGYILVPSMKYDLFLSAGICYNVDFENDFLKMYPSVPCFAFDRTIQQLCPEANEKIQWISKNIGAQETDRETNLHKFLDNYHDIFLKMDIEGGEYSWIQSCSDSQLQHLKQIVIEVHWPTTLEKWDMVYGRLKNTHWLVHVHGNNYCGCFQMEGRPIPEVLELTYIRKSDWPALHYNTIGFPIELDSPNNPSLPEHGLRGFPFEMMSNE
jgi:hypothetical protein